MLFFFYIYISKQNLSCVIDTSQFVVIQFPLVNLKSLICDNFLFCHVIPSHRRFRHAAVRSMLGGKKKHAFQKSFQTNGTTPRLVALVEKVKSLDENEVPTTGQ